jgi:methylated-DNA-[protein]-cysteine S-methyltransferase
MTNDHERETATAIEALRRLLPPPPAEATHRSRVNIDRWFEATAPTIAWQHWTTPIGPLFLAAGDEGLIRISYQDSEADFLAGFDRRARLVEDSHALAPYRQQLGEYFDGDLESFTMPLDLSRLTDFQRRVLSTIARIPAGAVWTYRQVAVAVGKPKAARAVGQALGSNPLPIVLPCHRVIASDGTLGGYAGGLAIKRKLLKHEGAQLF